ncbi:MAG: NAD(P)H-dependent oxidoreductase [Proteobacteria bacterium]|uniref:NAD(P)H-dependent oxidoreductase n=1 Tax=Aquabacterium sp. TaxID=1872578 RepID=UPI0035C74446|nr:NAD(P)H-dependent oxidoreductase [Pseudomonadota bacterium]
MNVLIVHAHPEPQSFCAAMCTVATEHLRAMGHQVRVSDLYAVGFNPVASAADFQQRHNPDHLVYALEQRHAQANGTLAADVRGELAKLLWCDLVIFNFPIFWFSVPAMLKGWIDRVLVSGVVYGGKRFYDRGGLEGKKAMLAVTIGGQSHMFTSDGVHGPLNDMLKPLLQGTLGYAGLSVLPPFVAWHVPYISAAERGHILADYRARLDSLDSATPLPMPSLAHFDERMRPLG